jgi:hypothetical protein
MIYGWEGSAHDSFVLQDALSRPSGLKIPEVVDKTHDLPFFGL